MRREQWPLVGRHEELDAAVAVVDDAQWRGVVIHGPAGVGKSRLAAEVASQAEADGHAVVRARATAVSASMPFGPIVHLLPPGVLTEADPVARYRMVTASLPAGEGRAVLLLDDMHHLDAASAGLVSQVLDGGQAVLVGTVRDGNDPSPAVASLWRRDDLRRVDLTDLLPDDVDALVHLALGGPVHADAVAALGATSAGNPLFVRELLLAARTAGTLVEQQGVWFLRGDLASTPLLSEAVHDRLRHLSGAGRAALDLVAMWEPIGLSELEAVVGAASVDELDRAGLVDVGLDGRRAPVRLTHPLYGEVVRAAMSTLNRRRVLLDGAARIEAAGARRRGDQLRVAVARIDASGSADPVLLLAAARVARQAHDHALVERLTRLTEQSAGSSDLTLLRAEALHELGQFDEVERVLAETALPTADHDAVPLVALRVRNLNWGLQRPDDALAVNRDARETITDPLLVDELITDEAVTLLYSSRPDEALLALSAMSDHPTARSRVLRSITESPALLATGRCETVLDLIDDAHEAHRRLEDSSAIAHPGIHVVYKVKALLDAGRLTEGRELAQLGYDQARRGGPPLGRTWFLIGLGRAALLAGQPRTARRWLAEGIVASSGSGFDGPHRLQLSFLATAQAWLGDVEGATSSLAELDATPPAAFFEAEHDLGRAWLAAVTGDPVRARSVLAAAADRAGERGERASEIWLLHHLVRLGEMVGPASRLTALEERCEGALVAVYAEHARALASGDPAGLDRVAARFAELGAWLAGAEAANAAADAHRRNQDQRAASASLVASRSLAAHCEGASTPGLLTASTVVPLTAREREVGTLAAAGLSSRDIGARLFLSRRTVENHLQNVYTKLGVSSRSELAQGLHGTLIGPRRAAAPPPASPPP